MRRLRRHPLLALTAGAMLIGCQVQPGVSPAPMSPITAPAAFPRIHGRLVLPDERQVAATSGEIVDRATVSILDSAGQTVAATVTDASGNFTLDVNGSFTPTSGATYTVEAIKGLASSTSASNAVRLRTLLQWTGAAWNSCTGGSTVTLSPTTTAVAIIKAKLAGVSYAETMGTVSGTGVTSGNAALNANWQAVRDLVTDLLWRDLDPVARIGLSGGTFAPVSDRATLLQPNLSVGAYASASLMLDGSVQLAGSLPRPKAESEVTFAIPGLAKNAAVVTTDGAYLYTKTWGGADNWNKTGTGFGGTTQAATFSAYANAMTTGYSAACRGGYLYQIMGGAGNNGTVERLTLSSGALTTVPLGTPALYRETGLSGTGSSLCYLNTDGTYFYNGAFSIDNGGYNGFTVRIYDAGFNMIRQVYLDGANTPLANTSYYSDTFLYDGVYAYAFEWAGKAGFVARMRRYRLADGQLEAEVMVPQDYPDDDPLTGSYDWVNNKFWFGDYQTNTIHRTAGRWFPSEGTWTSAPLDAGSATPLYGRFTFNAVAVNGQSVRFQVRSANDRAALASATWYGPTGTGDSYTASGTALNPIHRRNRWLQIRATLTPDTSAMLSNSGPLAGGGSGPSPSANTTPRLYGMAVEVTP